MVRILSILSNKRVFRDVVGSGLWESGKSLHEMLRLLVDGKCHVRLKAGEPEELNSREYFWKKNKAVNKSHCRAFGQVEGTVVRSELASKLRPDQRNHKEQESDKTTATEM